jgi:competence protein ComEC
MSCVLRISNGSHSALLAGDIEQAQEAQLLDRAARVGATSLKSDLLVVPHHGSKFSSSAAFLTAVQPRIALVQAGYRNRFGHPAESVLARYAKAQIQVVDTPRCGAVTWQSAQSAQVSCQRSQGLRYWHHQVI